MKSSLSSSSKLPEDVTDRPEYGWFHRRSLTMIAVPLRTGRGVPSSVNLLHTISAEISHYTQCQITSYHMIRRDTYSFDQSDPYPHRAHEQHPTRLRFYFWLTILVVRRQRIASRSQSDKVSKFIIIDLKRDDICRCCSDSSRQSDSLRTVDVAQNISTLIIGI